MITFLRALYFDIIVTPIIWLVLGLNVRRGELLPKNGPAIIVANHNSHLDTMVIMVLLRRLLPIVKPVAAADYFLKNKYIAWFALNIIGIVPIYRASGKDALEPAKQALKDGNIIIIFPEGSRGEPGVMQELKKGVSFLAKEFPDIPVIPIGLFGLCKALPKGEALLVPFFCDVYVDNALYGKEDPEAFNNELEAVFNRLHDEADVQGCD